MYPSISEGTKEEKLPQLQPSSPSRKATDEDGSTTKDPSAAGPSSPKHDRRPSTAHSQPTLSRAQSNASFHTTRSNADDGPGVGSSVAGSSAIAVPGSFPRPPPPQSTRPQSPSSATTIGPVSVTSGEPIGGGYFPAPELLPSPQPITSSPSRQESHSRLTPGLQVRAGLLSRIYRGLGEMRGNRRTGLLLMGLVTFAQLVAFVTVLALSSGQQCDQPLQAYIIVHTVRVTLSWPASFYMALAPRRPSRNDTNPEETIRNRESRRVFGNVAWDHRIKMFQDVMTLLAFTWFILGNYLFFSTKTCKQTSPQLYWTSLAVVIFGWLYALEIIFLVLAVTFFLPIVIIGIRLFGWGSKKQEIGPCDQDQIKKIPLVLYIPAAEEPAASQPSNGATTQIELGPMSTTPSAEEKVGGVDQVPTPQSSDSKSDPQNTTSSPQDVTSVRTTRRGRRRRKLARLFFSVKRGNPSSLKSDRTFSTSNNAYIPTPFPLHPLPANQSTCPICLCDFEPPPAADSGVDPAGHTWEPLRKLPVCGHCFHKDCLDEWLGTSGRCPLCQVPVEGEKKGKKRGIRRGRSGEGGEDTERGERGLAG